MSYVEIEDEFRMSPIDAKMYAELATIAQEKPRKSVEWNLGDIENVTITPPKFDEKQIKDVIFNDPATIVFWKDGTKTVVKCQKDKGDTYNPELGLAMCIIKKMCGNKGNYNNVFNKWMPKED